MARWRSTTAPSQRRDPAASCAGCRRMPTSESQGSESRSRSLRAGPFSVLLDDGDLRALCLGDREVIRRIAVVVRGPRWQTIPTTRSNVIVESGAESFRVEYDALSQQGDLS